MHACAVFAVACVQGKMAFALRYDPLRCDPFCGVHTNHSIYIQELPVVCSVEIGTASRFTVDSLHMASVTKVCASRVDVVFGKVPGNVLRKLHGDCSPILSCQFCLFGSYLVCAVLSCPVLSC